MKFENPFKKKPATPEDEHSAVMSRRDFLRIGAATVGATVGGGSLMKLGIDTIQGKTADDYKRDITELFNESELTEKILNLKETIKQRYGIDVILEQDELIKTSAAFKHTDLELRLTKQIESLEILQEELMRYPDFMITQYGLPVIALASSRAHTPAAVGAHHYGGHIDAEDVRFQSELVFFYDWNAENEVPEDDRVTQEENPGFSSEQRGLYRRAFEKNEFRRNIHHELTHLFLDAKGSEQSPRLTEGQFTERWDTEFKAWNEAQRADFVGKYPELTHENPNRPRYNQITDTVPGVARGYGLTNEQEDRATIMEEMMGGVPDKERFQNDPILREKMELLQEYYRDVSCGLMDEAFWTTPVSVQWPDKVQLTFLEKAERIIQTAYEESDYQNVVSKEKYEGWQNKLKHTTLATQISTR